MIRVPPNIVGGALTCPLCHPRRHLVAWRKQGEDDKAGKQGLGSLGSMVANCYFLSTPRGYQAMCCITTNSELEHHKDVKLTARILRPGNETKQ